MGSGRGGTSLLAGMIARGGYYAGSQLHPPRHTNPKGFFEDVEINSINEALLEPLRPDMSGGRQWLVALPLDASIPTPDAGLEQRIRAQLAHTPYCFKDPRFCYTLDIWRPHLGETVFLCVFRPPLATARSIVAEVQREEYLAPLRGEMTIEHALSVWNSMFRWVLERQSTVGEWLFVHYEQLLDGSAIRPLEEFLKTGVDREFADPSLDRSAKRGLAPAASREIYRELCARAGCGRFRPRRRLAAYLANPRRTLANLQARSSS